MTIESDQPRTEAGAKEGSGSVSYLDQALWQQLADADNPAKFAVAWLSLQCAMINAVEMGVVVLRQETSFIPVASWPNAETETRELANAAEHAIKESKGIVHRASGSGNSTCLAYPFSFAGAVQGVVALKMNDRTETQLRSVMRQLQWGVAWFEVFHHRGRPVLMQKQNERLAMVLQTAATSLDHAGFMPSISALATELATNLGCERVSLGFLEKQNMVVKAISHSAQFDKRSNLVRQIGLAMDEARDQLSIVVFPRKQEETFLVRQAHQQLASAGGSGSVCTILIATDEEVFGAFTLEHKDPDFFTHDVINTCKQVALVSGPILELKRRDERLLIKKVADSLARLGAKIVGEEYLVAKASVIAAILVLAWLSIATGTYRVSADATLEGLVQRHISVPVDGYIEAAHARAGDMVNEGDPLFSLDDKDMQLEKLRWASQRLQAEQKYREALSKRDQGEAGIQKAQLDQANIQIGLIDSQLARINAVAPFDGLVVSGDLSQMLGAPVRKGDTLLQLAPLDGYRIILDVDERDVTRLEAGQVGELSLSSLPGQIFEFQVDKITPESTAREGRNTFRVEARLVTTSDRLRPGMQGHGKVSIEARSLIWIWTHSFFDWLRIWTWSWWP
jgi:RND family efflux transporter MFP subunit